MEKKLKLSDTMEMYHIESSKICFIVLIQLVVSLFSYTDAQDIDLASLQQEFPNKDIVYLNYDTNVNIELDNGELLITESISKSKILLTEKAKLYEEESISYYDANKINDIEASSQVPKGKKYKKHKVKEFRTIETISKRYFYDDSYSIQFTYPEAREGTLCNVSYTHEIDNPIFMPSIYFASNIPIKEMNVTITCDEDVDLLIHEFNIAEPLKFRMDKKRGKRVYKLTLKDIQTADIEENGRSFQAIVPHIALAIASYKLDGADIKVMGELDDLFNTYSKFIAKVDLNTSAQFDDTVDSIITSASTDMEKVGLIYQWVKENIKYIAFEDNMGGFIPRSPQVVFDRKFGDCKDLSALIVKMLDVVGISGSYAWVGTRDLPYEYSDACGVFIDNHMIAVYYSEVDKKYYYLDATNEYLPYGMVPPQIQEKQVMVYQSPSSYEVIDAGLTDCSANLNLETCQLRIEDEQLVGHFKITLDGYQIPNYQYVFKRMNKSQLEKRFQTYFAKGSNKSTLTNISVNDTNRPFEIDYDITISEYTAHSKDEIYVNMNLDKLLNDSKIADNRTQSIDLKETSNYKKNYTLEIPDGYIVSYMPEDFSFGEGDLSCSITYSEINGFVHYSYDLCLNTLWLETKDFPIWNDFIKKLKKSYRENIILSKK